MLSLPADSQRQSTACPVPDTFFALSLLRASASSPTSVQPEIKKLELTGMRAYTHKPQCISQIFMSEWITNLDDMYSRNNDSISAQLTRTLT